MDLREIEHWYRTRTDGVEVLFRARFEIVLERIARHPLGHPIVRAPFRHALLVRFPYAVYFAVTSDTVWVVAVKHVARDASRFWRRRG